MNLLYFTVLLFGANADDGCETTSSVTDIVSLVGTRKDSIYYSHELNITESLTELCCHWGGKQCYVECNFVNVTTNICVNNSRNVSLSTTGLNRTRMEFITNEQNVTCDVTKCISDLITELIKNSSNSNDLTDLKRPTLIKNMCTKLFSKDKAVKNVYMRAEKKYIDALISLPFNETTKNYNLKDFALTVVKTDTMNTDLGQLQISAPKVNDDDLPLDVSVPTEAFFNVSKVQKKVGVLTYPSDKIYINDQDMTLMSKVVRVEIAGREINNLKNRLAINFTLKHNEIPENRTLACLYYNVDGTLGQEWEAMGSFTNLENFNSSNMVTCSYTHMTPFAVLLVDMTQVDPNQWKILSYITYIGCSLSAFFSAINVILYIFMKKSIRENSISIHASLSIALFLLNTSFLLIEWNDTWSNGTVCVIIAVIIQYSLLSCFSWMAIEAIHLYLLLIKVYNTYIKHYMLKLSLFGWGVPAVLVGGSLCGFGSKPMYGTVKIGGTNETQSFCWITDTKFFYGMNITCFSLMFLFNTCILAAVMHQIFSLQSLNVRGRKLPSRKDICTVLSLTVLLGLTWGLAFFTVGYTNYPILYLFCILNSLQGLFLFLWFYGTMKKNTRSMKESASVCVPSSASENIYESSFSK